MRHEAAARLAVMWCMTLGVAAPAAGQTHTDERLWTAVSLRGKVTADASWRWTADTLVQSRDGVRTLDQVLEHVMLTRDVGGVGIGVGYALGAGFRNRTLLEHRLTQAVTWSSGVGTRVSLRSLLEERFLTGRNAMLLRTRQQVRVVWPLAAHHGLRGIVSEEVSWQADSRALTALRPNGNRLFVGIGLSVAPGSTVEIGYLNAYARTGSNGRQSSHVLSASLAVSLAPGRRPAAGNAVRMQ
jgi:hypothetical protein